MGNRRDMGGVPTTGNRYAAFNGASYTYDADGNLIHKIKVGVYDIYYYWNALNQLDSVVNNGYRTQFEYNAFDKPIRVKEGSSYPLQVQRYLLWDGENLLAQLDTAGQRGVDYGYLPGALDHPIAYEHGPTWPPAMAFVDVDEAGNVIGSVEAGSLRQDNSYDAWGAVTSNIPTDQSLYWKGLFWNGANTGLYYMRNRWYDPESGRFLSEDPAGFAGSDNLYAFAGNDPINGRDPSGLGDCRWVVHSTITVSGAGPTVTTTNGSWVCFPSPSYPGATNSNPIPSGPSSGPGYGSAPSPTATTNNGPNGQACSDKLRDFLFTAVGDALGVNAVKGIGLLVKAARERKVLVAGTEAWRAWHFGGSLIPADRPSNWAFLSALTRGSVNLTGGTALTLSDIRNVLGSQNWVEEIRGLAGLVPIVGSGVKAYEMTTACFIQ